MSFESIDKILHKQKPEPGCFHNGIGYDCDCLEHGGCSAWEPKLPAAALYEFANPDGGEVPLGEGPEIAPDYITIEHDGHDYRPGEPAYNPHYGRPRPGDPEPPNPEWFPDFDNDGSGAGARKRHMEKRTKRIAARGTPPVGKVEASPAEKVEVPPAEEVEVPPTQQIEALDYVKAFLSLEPEQQQEVAAEWEKLKEITAKTTDPKQILAELERLEVDKKRPKTGTEKVEEKKGGQKEEKKEEKKGEKKGEKKEEKS